jgi:Inositol monophosphatase family
LVFLSFFLNLSRLKPEWIREIGCWPWDVCAGIVIAEEAGCVVTGSHDIFATSSSSQNFGIVTEEILTGRKYIVVRAIGDSKVNLMYRSIPFSPSYLHFN